MDAVKIIVSLDFFSISTLIRTRSRSLVYLVSSIGLATVDDISCVYDTFGNIYDHYFRI